MAEVGHSEHGKRSQHVALDIRTHRGAAAEHPGVDVRVQVGSHLADSLLAGSLLVDSLLAEGREGEGLGCNGLAEAQEEVHRSLAAEDIDRSQGLVAEALEAAYRSIAVVVEDREEDVRSHRLDGCRIRDSPGLDTCSKVGGSSDRFVGLGM